MWRTGRIPQYARGLSLEDQLHLVRRSHGRSGPNRDYVLATVDALATMGIEDRGLSWIAHHLRGVRPEPLPRRYASGGWRRPAATAWAATGGGSASGSVDGCGG